MPCWTGVEECVVYEGEVALPRIGSGESVNGVARTSGPDECREVNKGTLDKIICEE